jgi:S1-C subfamily serine protease
MKFSFFFLIICLLFGASICCGPPPKNAAQVAQEEREFVKLLQLKTVALIKKDVDGTIFPYCAGVWVAKNKILTAHHCVTDEGDFFFYRLKSDKKFIPRLASLIKEDKANDLALLITLDEEVLHPIAKVGDDGWTGQHVHVVGHPNMLLWSYTQGYISSPRKNINIETEEIQSFFQISAPIWKGNSGGGAFDDNGNLIGISSWIMTDAPLTSFFVHQDPIREILKSDD